METNNNDSIDITKSAATGWWAPGDGELQEDRISLIEGVGGVLRQVRETTRKVCRVKRGQRVDLRLPLMLVPGISESPQMLQQVVVQGAVIEDDWPILPTASRLMFKAD